MNGKLNFKIFLYFFFLIYFVIGLMIYKDYGVGLEEHFQRQNGFYWLNHFFSLTNFEDFKSLTSASLITGLWFLSDISVEFEIVGCSLALPSFI